MQAENNLKHSNLEKARKYIAKYIDRKENHESNKQRISVISGLLSIFFIIGNYFNFLRVEDKYTWKGISFFFLSLSYGFFCLWLYIEGLLRVTL